MNRFDTDLIEQWVSNQRLMVTTCAVGTMGRLTSVCSEANTLDILIRYERCPRRACSRYLQIGAT